MKSKIVAMLLAFVIIITGAQAAIITAAADVSLFTEGPQAPPGAAVSLTIGQEYYGLLKFNPAEIPQGELEGVRLEFTLTNPLADTSSWVFRLAKPNPGKNWVENTLTTATYFPAGDNTLSVIPFTREGAKVVATGSTLDNLLEQWADNVNNPEWGLVFDAAGPTPEATLTFHSRESGFGPQLVVPSIPEPSSALMGFLGSLLLLGNRRRWN